MVAALMLVGIGLSTSTAQAQSTDTAAAEELFEQGRQLLRAGNAAAACPKLAESLRIDPSTGTLLALAMCHEAEGKLASAWAGFVSVQARARNEGRSDREQAALARAQALRPRLSTLEVRVPKEVAALEGLVIRRDGTVLGHGAWNVVVPIDGGEHTVEVTASGKATWLGKVQVKPEVDAAAVTVPALSAAAGAPERTPEKPTGQWGTLEWAGVGVAGAGVIGLGVGGYFLSSALGKKADSSEDCDGNLCGTTGSSDRRSAVEQGNMATVSAIAGGVLAAGGATLFVLGRVRARHTEATPPAGGQLAFSAGPAGVGAQYTARF